MESRNITLTICGEWLDFSPRDRKAVCKIDDLFKSEILILLMGIFFLLTNIVNIIL